ncbi:unnamed protein product [Ectocarpus sp. 12 AP-2014]
MGGLTQSYSKDGAPEWKWLGNCPKVRARTRGACFCRLPCPRFVKIK